MCLTTKMRQKNLWVFHIQSLEHAVSNSPPWEGQDFPNYHGTPTPATLLSGPGLLMLKFSSLPHSFLHPTLLNPSCHSTLTEHKLPEDFHSGYFWGVKAWQSFNVRFIKWGFHSFALLGGLFLCLNIIFGWQQDTDSAAPSSLGWSPSTPHWQPP